eukprot:2033733-Rhodomonas_salina.2
MAASVLTLARAGGAEQGEGGREARGEGQSAGRHAGVDPVISRVSLGLSERTGWTSSFVAMALLQRVGTHREYGATRKSWWRLRMHWYTPLSA